MTKFNFRFQKILDVKEIEKDFAQIQMADAIKLEEVGHLKKQAIHTKIMDAERLKKDKQQDGVNISELRMLVTYIHQLQDLLVSSDRELVHLQNNVTKTRSHLQMKAQEEKTWGNLKQQEFTTYVERNKVIEQNFFDDLASTRFYRTSQASLAERG